MSNPESEPGAPAAPPEATWQHERAPAWFRHAVALPTRSHDVEADGARLHYLSWNHDEADKPPLWFLHGFRAHARWWSCIAPFFTARFRVYALDFSGMGDSAPRAAYDSLSFALEIAEAMRDAGSAPATLVGHSFGGSRVLKLCAERPELVARALVIDSYVHFADADVRGPPLTLGPRKVYPTIADAKARYRLTPEDPTVLDYARDYVAYHSLAPVPGGYRWKFAENLSHARSEPDGGAVLRQIQVPVTYLYGALSPIMHGGRPEKIVSHLAHGRGPIAIPEAGHHVPLAQPLALVAALRALLC